MDSTTAPYEVGTAVLNFRPVSFSISAATCLPLIVSLSTCSEGTKYIVIGFASLPRPLATGCGTGFGGGGAAVAAGVGAAGAVPADATALPAGAVVPAGRAVAFAVVEAAAVVGAAAEAGAVVA